MSNLFNDEVQKIRELVVEDPNYSKLGEEELKDRIEIMAKKKGRR